VKAREVIQAEPRKPAEIKKLYADLLARVTLRTLAEAFDITPPTLVDGIVRLCLGDGPGYRQTAPSAAHQRPRHPRCLR
jgi:hypothetical protein